MITFKRHIGRRKTKTGSNYTLLNVPKFVNSLWDADTIKKLSLDLDIQTGKLIVRPIYKEIS